VKDACDRNDVTLPWSFDDDKFVNPTFTSSDFEDRKAFYDRHVLKNAEIAKECEYLLKLVALGKGYAMIHSLHNDDDCWCHVDAVVERPDGSKISIDAKTVMSADSSSVCLSAPLVAHLRDYDRTQNPDALAVLFGRERRAFVLVDTNTLKHTFEDGVWGDHLRERNSNSEYWRLSVLELAQRAGCEVWE